MKQRLLIVLFALSLFFTSCGSDNDLVGNWIKSSSFEGRARSGAVSFVIGDYAYVGTGYDGKDALKTFYKYSLQDGWSKVQNEFPGAARREAVAFAANGKVYVGLGVNDDDERLGDFYEFDPSTDTWNTTAIDMTGGPSARQGAIAFSIDGVGYVGTGYGFQEGEDRTNLKDFYKYDGNWTKIAYDGEKSRNSTAFVIDNKAYIVSGENSMKYVWEYDPSKVSNTFNGWTRKEDLDDDNNWEGVQRSGAVSFVINGKGYIATGRNSGLSREVWEYDAANDRWDEKTSLESPEVASRENAVAFSLNNRGFVTTGTVSGSGAYFDDTWEFNPTMDEDDKDN
ncbi:galactose oxidase [Marinifilum sp. D714]|uniref:Kelch repeat-containing protein n=1 Tax=Marinifilum sp. D714 TaxID=2937523 RepID=UPI0027CAD4F4|nr:galactose oxidase [Marinifilum sp. D714]MDQ2178264.1 galactose oxidase [Marinifilum sp. D714]